MPQRQPAGVYFALFTLSGFAGLIYESIWSHYLKLFLGHAAYAQTLVLAIFMGGMAIGALVASRLTQRLRNPLLAYAGAEMAIGVLAIAFHRVFVAATGWAFDTVLPGLAGGGVDAFKWGLASLLILPASVLLGTTFPLMSAGLLRRLPLSAGRTLSMLYFTNSVGAALGVLASGFVLIDRVGLPGTIAVAGAMNVSLATVVWLIARRAPPAPGTAAPPAPAERIAAAGAARTPVARAVMALAFATGTASFIYEITWIRMLTMGLGASTHAFEIMLAAFIAAMALGAFWVRNRIAAMRDDIAWLAALLVAKALFAVYAVWIYGDALSFIGWAMGAVSRTEGGYVLISAAGLLASMLVMFPTAFCAGMTLPIATHALTSRGVGEASIGRVYSANTAGCIVGAVFATHAGMEALGIKGLTGTGALLDIAVALLLIAVTTGPVTRARLAAGLAVASLVGLGGYFGTRIDLLRMSSGVYRHGHFDDPATSSIQFYRDGKTATIAVVDTGPIRSVRTNGKPDASITMRDPGRGPQVDETTMVLAAALAIAVKPEARAVANIGFGSGLTTHALLGSPVVGHVDTIEIERAMVEGARLFAPRNDRAFHDPRSRVHIEDAKTFFAARGERYDVIVSEPSNPWVSGVSTLFSEEFYARVKRYMADDGVLVQWIQAYEIDLDLLSTIFQALGAQFSDYAVYGTYSDLLVVATPKGKLPPMRDDLFRYPLLARDLGDLGIRGLRDLQVMRVGGRAVLEPLFTHTGMPANSDFHPVVDQRGPRARFLQDNTVSLLSLRLSRAPVLPLLDGDWRLPMASLAGRGTYPQPRIAQAIGGAESLRIARGGEPGASPMLPAALRTDAVVAAPRAGAGARGLEGACAGSQDEWLRALDAVAGSAMPVIEEQDVRPWLEQVARSGCARTLGAQGQRRLRLLEAISRRDAAAIGPLAAELLEDPADGEAVFHLQCAIAAYLATHDIARAVELATRHLQRVPWADLRSLQWRLLLSNLDDARRGVK